MSHKAIKIYIYRIRVEGYSNFPLDMLRYDSCIPFSSQDVSAIDHSLSNPRGSHKVQLLMYSHSKVGPTKDRWKSFGWNVVTIEPVDLG